MSGSDHLLAVRAFLRQLQDFVITAFYAEIYHLQSGLLELEQVFRRFAQDVEWTAIAGYPRESGEMQPQQCNDFEQFFCRQDQSVAIGKEYPPQVGIASGRIADNRFDFCNRSGPELHVAIHRTEAATVMRAADGSAQNKTVGFARRTKYHSFSIVKHEERLRSVVKSVFPLIAGNVG